MVTSASVTGNLEVVSEIEIKEMNTINDILSSGQQEDILNFLRTQNLNNKNIFSFDKIYWLLNNKDFYQKVLAILKQRYIFDKVVWQMAFQHHDIPTAIEYLDLVLTRDIRP